ncbi:hypothetical protein [Streptomyces diacarni]|uniref:hypothetical protein n=1 Tax=Streptomyces diacarni TaxID=2800381 RepID=UPI0015F08B70|nr:hypothetical protein [Streptomyces diacarni]
MKIPEWVTTSLTVVSVVVFIVSVTLKRIPALLSDARRAVMAYYDFRDGVKCRRRREVE